MRLLYLLLMMPSFSIAQTHAFQKVDMAEVKRLTTDASLPSYYPTLLKRFNAFDSSLTNTDYRLLYYGFAFQKGYNRLAHHREAAIREQLQRRQNGIASKLCDTILNAISISLAANYLKAAALYAINNDDPKALPYRARYRKLRDAILSSGDGFRCESALRTIYDEDDDDIMTHYFELEPYQTKQAEGDCEVFTLPGPSKYFKASKIYFVTTVR